MTKKPCPGCKKVDRCRSADDVCSECKRLLAIGRDTVSKSEAQSEIYCWQAGFAAHCLPYLDNSSDEAKVIQRAYYDIAEQFHLNGEFPSASQNYRENQFIEGNCGCSSYVWFNLSKRLRDNLNAIYQAIVKMRAQAYEKGLKSGSNLLISLATGEMTMKELNTRTVGDD